MDKQFDLIILGGGPAGYNASERAAHAGLRTLVIEKRALGGVCLNEGCVPTKTLLNSAKIYHYAQHSEKYGVSVSGATLNHAAVLARKNKVVKTLVSGVSGTLKRAGVTVVEGEGTIAGRSADGYNVTVNGEAFTGKRLLIATGSSAAVPPIPGLHEALQSGFALTNREMLDLAELPKKLLVIGGGVIGLEMANYLAVAGVEVIVIEALDHIAGANDADIIALLQKNFEALGVTFHLSCKVSKIKNGSVVYQDASGQTQEIMADKVLLSIGRRANTAGIGLESIGVELERGAIKTDERMKTNIPEVYAAGDVNGKSMLAHTGYREGEVAVNNMLGQKDRMRYSAIPAVVYTNPELGAVGETEVTAKEKGVDVKIVKLPMQYSGRYVAENEGGTGICKLIFDKKHDVLIGAHVYANYASEFIVAAGMMIEMQLRVSDMKEFVYPHPTVCEIFREAVFQY